MLWLYVLQTGNGGSLCLVVDAVVVMVVVVVVVVVFNFCGLYRFYFNHSNELLTYFDAAMFLLLWHHSEQHRITQTEFTGLRAFSYDFTRAIITQLPLQFDGV